MPLGTLPIHLRKLELSRAHTCTTPHAAVHTVAVFLCVCLVDDLYRFDITAYEQKALMGVRLIGMANKMQCLRRSWGLSHNWKHNEVSFSKISTDSLCLRVAQMPRSQDLVIFVLTTTDNRQTNFFTPCCACMRGNKCKLALFWC